MDWIRLILIFQIVLLLALLLPATIERGIALHRSGSNSPGWQLSRGRFVTQIGFTFLMLGALQGLIELWNDPHSIRLLWTQIGIWGAFLSWYLVDRREWIISD